MHLELVGGDREHNCLRTQGREIDKVSRESTVDRQMTLRSGNRSAVKDSLLSGGEGVDRHFLSV